MNVEHSTGVNKPNIQKKEDGPASSVAPPRRPPTVVVVDDNLQRRTHLLSQLALRAGTTLLAIGYHEFAELVHQLSPSVVVANPVSKQVATLSELLVGFGSGLAIVVGEQVAKELGRALSKEARIVQVEDFSDVQELCGKINNCLPPTRQVSPPFTAAEFVQLAGLGGHSIRLICANTSGRYLGEIHMLSGQLQAAHSSGKTGFDAFAELVIQTDLSLHFGPLVSSVAQLDLSGNWQSLILKAMTQADERARSIFPPAAIARTSIVPVEQDRRLSESPASLERLKRAAEVPALPVTGMRETLESVALGPDKGSRELIEEGVKAIIDKDYGRAIETLERASKLDPKNRAVRHQLKRLYNICSL